MHVAFTKKYDWALVPEKHRMRPTPDEGELFERNFRWVRQPRAPERCWPWRLGQEIGWVIRSPVDICLSPVDDVQVCIPPDEIVAFGQATGYEEVWPRGRNALAVRRTGWLRLYDFQTDAGSASMFVPNGAGSVEWHLGWEMEFPESHYVMVLPLGEPVPGLEVPVGVLDHRTVQRINRESGFSVAVRPHRPVRLARDQAFARVILLHHDSVRAKAESPAAESSDA